MGKLPAAQFYFGDWINDTDLMASSDSTQGIWMRALCRMHFNTANRGQLTMPEEALKRVLHVVTDDAWRLFVNDLQTFKFGDYETHGNGTVTLRNRRMVADEKARKQAALRVKRFRQRAACNALGNATVPNRNIASSSSSSSSSSFTDLRSREDQEKEKYKKEKESESVGYGFKNSEPEAAPSVANDFALIAQQPTVEEPKPRRKRKRSDRPPADYTGFDDFWDIYPRPDAKQKARESWGHLTPEEKAVAITDPPLRLLANWAGGVVPHASTYLNQKRFFDPLANANAFNGTLNVAKKPAFDGQTDKTRWLRNIKQNCVELQNAAERSGGFGGTSQGYLPGPSSRRNHTESLDGDICPDSVPSSENGSDGDDSKRNGAAYGGDSMQGRYRLAAGS